MGNTFTSYNFWSTLLYIKRFVSLAIRPGPSQMVGDIGSQVEQGAGLPSIRINVYFDLTWNAWHVVFSGAHCFAEVSELVDI